MMMIITRWKLLVLAAVVIVIVVVMILIPTNASTFTSCRRLHHFGNSWSAYQRHCTTTVSSAFINPMFFINRHDYDGRRHHHHHHEQSSRIHNNKGGQRIVVPQQRIMSRRPFYHYEWDDQRNHNNKIAKKIFLYANQNNDHHDNDDDHNTMHHHHHHYGLYIHIPYCRRRCRYCNFAIVPIGDHRMMMTTTTNTTTATTTITTDTIQQERRQQHGFMAMNEMYFDAMIKELQIILSIMSVNRTATTTKIARNNNVKNMFRSIYFGGGTPSLAPIPSIRELLAKIMIMPSDKIHQTNNNHNNYNDDIDHIVEMTMEMDPGTFQLEQLWEWKQMGINRISLGVQSFDDNILSTIGRTHRHQDIIHSLEMIDQVFGHDSSRDNHNHTTTTTTTTTSPTNVAFGTTTTTTTTTTNRTVINYSIDLISGLPGLTLAKWAETLEIATNLHPKPTHLSLYDLQIEQGTVFDKWFSNNNNNRQDENVIKTTTATSLSSSSSSTPTPQLPSVEECAFMYRYAAGYLKAKGYEHYEISSYALVDYNNDNVNNKSNHTTRNTKMTMPSPFRSRHNQMYWSTTGQWHAIGLGSTSLIEGKSYARPKAMSDYIAWVQQQEYLDVPDWMPRRNRRNTYDTIQNTVIHNHVDDAFHDPCGKAEAINHHPQYLYERFTDMIMTRLRTSDGLDLDWIIQTYREGHTLVQHILTGARLGLELGLVQMIGGKNEEGEEQSEEGMVHALASDSKNSNVVGRLRLTDPDGFLYSNTIISSIFVALDDASSTDLMKLNDGDDCIRGDASYFTRMATESNS